MSNSIELLATCWTIAGDVYPGASDVSSPYPLERRLAAAASAGYRGTGLWHGDLLRVFERDRDYQKLRRQLEVLELRSIELEFLTDWFSSGDRRRRSDAVRRDLFRAADALGARHLKVMPPMQGESCERARLIDEFGRLCSEAAEYGLAVAMEMMPFTSLPNIDEALSVVTDANAGNGGLLLDIWHVVRSGVTDFSTLSRLPSQAIIAVELDDADLAMPRDLMDDTMNSRKPCGEGQFDVPGFVMALRQAGYRGPFGVEILSDTFRRMTPEEAARISFSTTFSQLEALV